MRVLCISSMVLSMLAMSPLALAATPSSDSMDSKHYATSFFSLTDLEQVKELNGELAHILRSYPAIKVLHIGFVPVTSDGTEYFRSIVVTGEKGSSALRTREKEIADLLRQRATKLLGWPPEIEPWTYVLTGPAPVEKLMSTDACSEARKWYNEGLALSDNSEREASYYQRAIELCPDFFEAHNRLGEVYTSLGKYDAAIREFKQAARNESYVEAINNLGEVYKIQGRYDLAAEAFTKALRIKPDFRVAQNNLKYVQKRLGVYDRAVEEPPERIPTAIFTRLPGMTLPRGSFLVDLQYEYWNQEASLAGLTVEAPVTFGPPSRDVDVQVWIFGVRYGLTNDFTVGLIPKYFSRTAKVPIPSFGIDAEPEVHGFGDTVFLTKYHLWGMRRTHLSAFHLLSIPTGDDKAEGKDQGVVRRIPLGSGGYDFTPGLAFTTVQEPVTLHSNLWYVFTQGRQAGDEFHFDLALVFPKYYYFMGSLELNYRWADSFTRDAVFQTRFGFQPLPPSGLTPGAVIQETKIREEGGYTLFLSPGMQVSMARGLSLELGVQIPIVKSGEGWMEDIVAHVGLIKQFF
jgi:tetratricopeptide (TPR) repeat protein